MSITDHQAKYYAHQLSARKNGSELSRLSQSLYDAQVDLNPHQIEAALFALQNPLRQGIMLADEVGLGKTIEAGLVLCQMWAERKRKLLIICPASLRKQWAQELEDKFALPCAIIDSTILKKRKMSLCKYLDQLSGENILILSYDYASRHTSTFQKSPWDMVIMDEAHKVRSAYKKATKAKTAHNILTAFAGSKKLLLTATPLQNDLNELYGLSLFMDKHLFGDSKQFRKTFKDGQNLASLKKQFSGYIKRTLRKDVLEFIRYTERHTLTQEFSPQMVEQQFYQQVSDFLQQNSQYAIPAQNRHLLLMILRKLLASSPEAIASTLHKIRKRLIDMSSNDTEDTPPEDPLYDLTGESDFSSDYQDWEEEYVEPNQPAIPALTAEIAHLNDLISAADALTVDSKAAALLKALASGFAEMNKNGAAQKALIFTESEVTQKKLYHYLTEQGYRDCITLFSGQNDKHPQTAAIYAKWKQAHPHKISGSPEADKRAALIDHFRTHSQIMIATEAAAEGVNLQFCSLIINYDLPWNPQRIEQRIGRCHRYGQKYDVVVINFLNTENAADARVLDLLTKKFRLFEGAFGASDNVLGQIESGIDIERKIAKIYQYCRTPEEIEQSFNELQNALADDIAERKAESEQQLLDHFDEDVHSHVKISSDEAGKHVDLISKMLFRLTHHILGQEKRADFSHDQLHFTLHNAPESRLQNGLYRLVPHQHNQDIDTSDKDDCILYRLNHPLAQWCLQQASNLATPDTEVFFDYANYQNKISVIEQHLGHIGWLQVDKVTLSAQSNIHETLIVTACDENGNPLDDEFGDKLLNLPAFSSTTSINPPNFLNTHAEQHIQRIIDEQKAHTQRLLQQESMRLDFWAEEQKRSAEQAIKENRETINKLRREKNHIDDLSIQLKLEQQLKILEKERRKLRHEIDDIEDDINDKRDDLIKEIRQKLHQQTHIETLFTIRWHLSAH